MKFCWATYADDVKYLKEACALACSLKKVYTIFPLYIYISITDKLTIEHYNEFLQFKNQYLKNFNIIIKIVDHLCFDCGEKIDFRYTLNKFHCLELLQNYNKVCFIDSDVIFLINLDDIFDNNLNTTKIKAIIRENGCQYNAINNKDISGGIIVFSQSHFYLYDKIKNKEINLKYHNDEEFLNDLFLKSNLIQNLNNIDLFIHHDGGTPKFFFFKDYSFIKTFFVKNNLIKINNILINYDHKKINKREQI